MLHKGEAKLKETCPVPWTHHRKWCVRRCWQGWLYKVLPCGLKHHEIKSWALKVKDSRSQNGHICPYCARFLSQGRAHLEQVSWPTLTDGATPFPHLETISWPEELVWAVHWEGLFHLVTVLNLWRVSSDYKFVFNWGAGGVCPQLIVGQLRRK